MDLAVDAPDSGSYADVSPMGLVWSQEQVGPAGTQPYDAVRPVTVELAAQGGGAAASCQFLQRFAAPGVTRREVRDAGLVGTLFTPPGPGPHPAVVVLNGSGGGINEPRAALYASHGYAAFALGYFKAPGLPDWISNTPLEYFVAGVAWLRRAVQPAGGFVALSGQSRGGELVLLLASTFPDLASAVIGYVPGAVVHSGQSAADPAIGRDGPCWTLGGKPLPHVWEGNRTASWAPYDNGAPPRRHAHAVLTALQDPGAVARARIPVERIQGPVLLVSGTDDGSWPSTRYSEMVEQALHDSRHPYPVRHLRYEGAGHAILFPYTPTTAIVRPHPVSGVLSTGGGTPAANARANEESWAGVLAFLHGAVLERPGQ